MDAWFFCVFVLVQIVSLRFSVSHSLYRWIRAMDEHLSCYSLLRNLFKTSVASCHLALWLHLQPCQTSTPSPWTCPALSLLVLSALSRLYPPPSLPLQIVLIFKGPLHILSTVLLQCLYHWAEPYPLFPLLCSHHWTWFTAWEHFVDCITSASPSWLQYPLMPGLVWYLS